MRDATINFSIFSAVNKLSFIKYNDQNPNILVVGPVAGKKYSEMTFPILSPNPATNKNIS